MSVASELATRAWKSDPTLPQDLRVLQDPHGSWQSDVVHQLQLVVRLGRDSIALRRAAAAALRAAAGESLSDADDCTVVSDSTMRRLFFAVAVLYSTGNFADCKTCPLCWEHGKVIKSHVVSDALLNALLDDIGEPHEGRTAVVAMAGAPTDASVSAPPIKAGGTGTLSWPLLCRTCDGHLAADHEDWFLREWAKPFMGARDASHSLPRDLLHNFFVSLMWRSAMRLVSGDKAARIADKYALWRWLTANLERQAWFAAEKRVCRSPDDTVTGILHVDTFGGAECDTRRIQICPYSYPDCNLAVLTVQYHLLHFVAISPINLKSGTDHPLRRELLHVFGEEDCVTVIQPAPAAAPAAGAGAGARATDVKNPDAAGRQFTHKTEGGFIADVLGAAAVGSRLPPKQEAAAQVRYAALFNSLPHTPVAGGATFNVATHYNCAPGFVIPPLCDGSCGFVPADCDWRLLAVFGALPAPSASSTRIVSHGRAWFNNRTGKFAVNMVDGFRERWNELDGWHLTAVGTLESPTKYKLDCTCEEAVHNIFLGWLGTVRHNGISILQVLFNEVSRPRC